MAMFDLNIKNYSKWKIYSPNEIPVYFISVIIDKKIIT